MAPDPVKVATSVDDGDKYRDQSASSWNKKGRRVVLEQNNGNVSQKYERLENIQLDVNCGNRQSSTGIDCVVDQSAQE